MIWRRTRSHLVAFLTAALTSGCASATTEGARSDAEGETPPRMVSRVTPPMLRISSIPASGRAPIRVRFEVLIDAEGRPDMRTFRATGMGAAENQDALAGWIQSAAFAPARRGGVPVAGVFRGSLSVRVSRR